MLGEAPFARGFQKGLVRFAKEHTDETILLGPAYEV